MYANAICTCCVLVEIRTPQVPCSSGVSVTMLFHYLHCQSITIPKSSPPTLWIHPVLPSLFSHDATHRFYRLHHPVSTLRRVLPRPRSFRPHRWVPHVHTLYALHHQISAEDHSGLCPVTPFVSQTLKANLLLEFFLAMIQVIFNHIHTSSQALFTHTKPPQTGASIEPRQYLERNRFGFA